MNFKRFLASAFILSFFSIPSFSESRTGDMIVKPSLAYSTTVVVDVSDYSRFSAQAIYSSQTYTAHSVTQGSKSNNSITVGTNVELLKAYPASVSITITSHGVTALTDEVITLNGVSFTQGSANDIENRIWAIGASSGATALNISSVITGHPSFIASTANSAPGIVVASAAATGVYANGWTATVSTIALTLSAGVFQNGRDNAYVTFITTSGATTLTQGTDWTAQTSSHVTAGAIMTAINANATISPLVLASTGGALSSGIVFTTATLNGINAYTISTSTNQLSAANPTFINGATSEVSLASDSISETSHSLTTGYIVRFATTAPQVIPGGLATDTSYYAIRVDANEYKLATSQANALAGTAINITSLTNSSTFTVTPVTYQVGSNGFQWQASNDGTNWSSIVPTVAIPSFTFTVNGNTLFDFGDYNYRYLRMNYTAPTWGGLNVQVIQSGEKRH